MFRILIRLAENIPESNALRFGSGPRPCAGGLWRAAATQARSPSSLPLERRWQRPRPVKASSTTQNYFIPYDKTKFNGWIPGLPWLGSFKGPSLVESQDIYLAILSCLYSVPCGLWVGHIFLVVYYFSSDVGHTPKEQEGVQICLF